FMSPTSLTTVIYTLSLHDALPIFQQGVSGSNKTDTFMQTTQTGVLDVLIVIDNSGSMAEEQNNLAGKLQPLLSYVQGADWQIGRSEEHTSELQSRENLVCRLLLEK